MAPRTTGGGWPRTPIVAAALAGLVALTAAAPCRADDLQAFELAKNPFDAGQFDEAHARLSALLDPTLPTCEAGGSGRCRLTDPELVERARTLDAASLIALKRVPEADAIIGTILRANTLYSPNAALFPQEVIDRFTVVRGTLRPELEAIERQKAREEFDKRVAAQKARDADEKWIAEIQKLAGEEKLVQPNSRLIALVPFGVGQFQNGDVRLGIVFASGEVLLGGAALVAVAIVNSLASSRLDSSVFPAVNARIRTVATVNQVTFAAWAALTAAGVVQAQIAFVPSHVTTRPRPVPPRPKITPVATPVPGGAVLGVSGTF